MPTNGSEQIGVIGRETRKQFRESQLQRAIAVGPGLQLPLSWIGACLERCAHRCRSRDASSNRFVERRFARRPLMHQAATDEDTAESTIPDGKWWRQIHQRFDYQLVIGELMMDSGPNFGNAQRPLQLILFAAHDTERELGGGHCVRPGSKE